ncbi:DUF1501 domain-containing protein [Massilia sp. IC2-476]|uniref:DUF1501 domain-containing protein n=1 Tax=Massilia sp. IC2-476 TaxID=2887199 RepID=UPI001D123174|nr:DUF1501 domain-containing protein [Massilia sp. IC2-476]MCC2972268.1 DUF1501 domain-containing protein [Massilia sp. IC2-476]
MALHRRAFLAGVASLAAAPRVAFAQVALPTERRFVFIIQRGAADGLNTVIPYADPAYAELRGALAIEPQSAIRLDGTFALHPSLSGLGALYQAGQASFFHAVASPYRERSHFDGQNILETGGSAPYALKDGWMNRMAGLLSPRGKEAIAFAPTVPQALRGALPVASYAPSGLPEPNEDLMGRVAQLYAGDPQLHALWSAALAARGMAGGLDGRKGGQKPEDTGRMAAGFLARSDGPRIAMIETGGWDTHSGQNGRLAGQLRNLDELVKGLREGLGPVWDQTVVLVATEFGRTAAANGTGGTDHGTGAAAMLAGGAVQGGRVLADWPGLRPADLLEGRDLRPTLGLDTLIAQVCAETFRVEPGKVARALFPDLVRGKGLPRLLKA